ncbi:hypothetical protein EDD17DRAFT_1512829 [Pisolithus thermaeus]|nr:hypothetical protein EDD17DRAFT_1512829 [Pisolithus thermaeus]
MWKVWHGLARGNTEGDEGGCISDEHTWGQRYNLPSKIFLNFGGGGTAYHKMQVGVVGPTRGDGGMQWGQVMPGAGDGGRRQWQVMGLLEGVSVKDAHRQQYDLPCKFFKIDDQQPPHRQPLADSRISIKGIAKLVDGTGSLAIVNTRPTATSPSRSSLSTEVLPPLRVSFPPDVKRPATSTPSTLSHWPHLHQEVMHSPECSVCESEDASVLSLHAALQGHCLPPVLSEGCSWTCLDGDPFIHSVPGPYIVECDHVIVLFSVSLW